MTQAFNLSQLANKVNSSGQLNASTGLIGVAPASDTLTTSNFTMSESGGKLMFYYGATAIASLDSTGIFTTLDSTVSGGTP